MASRPPSRSPSRTSTRAKTTPGKKRRSTAVRQTVVTPTLRNEFDDLVQQVFELADVDQNGAIQFGEFLAHHEKFMDATDALPDSDYQETENHFRKLDKDRNGCLDQEEFAAYMEGLLAVLGARCFRQTCQDFIEKERQMRTNDGFDFRYSHRLLEQARMANYYMKPLQDAALGFLEQRADPNFVDETGSHCLLYAAGKSTSTFMVRLLESRANPAIHNKAYDCAAFRAARHLSLDTLGLLLLAEPPEGPLGAEAEEAERAGRDLVRNMSALDEAEIMKLLAKRADVNFKDESGWTPLTAAVFFGDTGCVDALLKTQRAPGKTFPRLRVDQHNGKGRAPLHVAARKGHADLVASLVQAKGNPDCQDVEGWTPLHHAAFNGRSEVVEALLKAGADPTVQGFQGLTPWQVTKMPVSSGTIDDHTLKKLKPPEEVDFTKVILPLLKDEDKLPYEKLQELLNLPEVHHHFRNLRIHEQCFDPRLGPNKVRLRRLWELLALPMVQRQTSGETDMPCARRGMSEEDMLHRRLEVASRQKEQQRFVADWLTATRGLRPDADWRHENRPEYGPELREAVEAQLRASAKELDRLYQDALKSEGGDEVARMPFEEVVLESYPSQLALHPIPVWVEEPDPARAFEALRLVAAAGMGKDDDDSLMAFRELLTLQPDFSTGPNFWRNVYRLWLSEYAKAADLDFHRQVTKIVDRFSELYHHDSEMSAAYRAGPVKTYKRMKVKEGQFGSSSHASYEGRTLASKIFDVIRGTIVVSCLNVVSVLLHDFFRPLDGRLKLVRIENLFSEDARPVHGFRNVVLTLAFDGGLMAGRCGRPGASMQVALLAEVQITLESFEEVQKNRQVLYDCWRGMYDWEPEDVLAEGDVPKTSRSGAVGLEADDDVPQPGNLP
uniref:EF-hand domain-containing protein n=1 Tax=Alexandrium monilatum TaxID=311494 RepID=A0A7S4QR61_9DINO